MAYWEAKSTHSKGKRKVSKRGKKIAHKTNRAPHQHKSKHISTRRDRNYSPEYRVKEKYTPLFYSGDYQPCTDQQEETQENYECFITRELALRMQIELEAQADVVSKLAQINL